MCEASPVTMDQDRTTLFCYYLLTTRENIATIKCMKRQSKLELDLKEPVRGAGREGRPRRKAASRPRVWHRERAEFPKSHPSLVTIRVHSGCSVSANGSAGSRSGAVAPRDHAPRRLPRHPRLLPSDFPAVARAQTWLMVRVASEWAHRQGRWFRAAGRAMDRVACKVPFPDRSPQASSMGVSSRKGGAAILAVAVRSRLDGRDPDETAQEIPQSARRAR